MKFRSAYSNYGFQSISVPSPMMVAGGVGVSVIVPFGYRDTTTRVENCVLSILGQTYIQRSQLEVILVNIERDSLHVIPVGFSGAVRKLTTIKASKYFPLSLARNLGAKQASFDTVAFVDSDMLLDPETLCRSLQYRLDLVTVWAVYLDEVYSTNDIAKNDVAWFRWALRGRCPAHRGYGGLVQMPRAVFLAMRGYDEVYDAGWGTEDNDIVDRAIEYGCGWVNLSNTDGILALHQYHETKAAKRDLDVLANREYYKATETVVRNIGSFGDIAFIEAMV